MADWKNGLCGCFGNCGLCIVTYFAPCVTAGRVAETQGKGCCLYGCLSILGPIGIYTRATVRKMVREQKGIEGSFCNDCVMHWFCGMCALVQEGQEVDAGGNEMQRQ
ncbi:hypothetical protein CAPTEDRAFT_224572 [Capitella teleta]|uniref:Uncharacterized protein n=1 Tax=Capitella teleta TaxID=283909 RepID=R7V9Z4_CAPTE|nr:hypothetical protein CAPTEDRAFT_224572 [Capitella teleta]|eukprot:ELU15424.1 hypothetical protein CAPTEDRAFT_224572 [Capitella teleta]